MDFNCARNFWQKVIVYIISLIYICLEYPLEILYLIKLQGNIDE